MVTEFKLPDIGEGIAEAEIVEWTVKEGDFVNEYQNIVKIETDKAVADLPSPVTGIMLKINFKKGDKVNVGAVLCVIGEKGEKVKWNINNKKLNDKVNDVVNNTVNNIRNESVVIGKILASPAVRKVAVERGIDLSSIKGSGADGQIECRTWIKTDFLK